MKNNNEKCGCDPEVESPVRRKLLGWIVGIINLSIFAAIFGPVIGFVGSPLTRKRQWKWVEIAAIENVPDGSISEIRYALQVRDGYRTVEREYAVFLRRNGQQLTAFDPTCTHLGCRIKFQERRRRFICPCHGGVFSDDGRVISGPPPKPLLTHPAKIEEGKVWLYREV